MRSLTHPVPTAPTPPRLSPEQRAALNAATHELHRAAWDIAQEAISLDDCETLAALTLVAYFQAIERYRTPSPRSAS